MAINRILDRVQSIDTAIGLIGKWFPYLGTTLVAAYAGYLAAVTEWLNVYGPIAWLFSALSAALLFISMCAIGSRGLLWYAQSKFTFVKVKQSTDGLNPLEATFQNRRIRLLDLQPPGPVAVTGKIFTRCELIGPVVVFFVRPTLSHSRFFGCDLIVVPDNPIVTNVLVLADATIRNCDIYNATMLIPESAVGLFESQGARLIYAGRTTTPSASRTA